MRGGEKTAQCPQATSKNKNFCLKGVPYEPRPRQTARPAEATTPNTAPHTEEDAAAAAHDGRAYPFATSNSHSGEPGAGIRVAASGSRPRASLNSRWARKSRRLNS